jgi:hypothetical protein
MQTSNIASRALRTADASFVWEEKLSGAQGSIEVEPCSTFRVRAVGATTVTIDGILAATMMANEIMIFNAGEGDPADAKATVTITIGAANAFVQVARNYDRKDPNA